MLEEPPTGSKARSHSSGGEGMPKTSPVDGSPFVSRTSRNQRGRLDIATCHLVKDVLDEHWSVEAAALRLPRPGGRRCGLAMPVARSLAAGGSPTPDRSDRARFGNAGRCAERLWSTGGPFSPSPSP